MRVSWVARSSIMAGEEIPARAPWRGGTTDSGIKIVQQLPVGIALEPNERDQQPLRSGASKDTGAILRQQSGPTLSKQAPPGAILSTDVNTGNPAQMGTLTGRILRANGGVGAHAPQAGANAGR